MEAAPALVRPVQQHRLPRAQKRRRPPQNWLHTAAQRGSPEGMLELGRLYRDGVGVEKDLVKAYVWFNRAAAARNCASACKQK